MNSRFGELPDNYWHCAASGTKHGNEGIVNDLSAEELLKQIVEPWHSGRPFNIGGIIFKERGVVDTIKITYTQQPQDHYATLHDNQTRASGIVDMRTDRRYLPIWSGEDQTHRLLFEDIGALVPEADENLIIRLCSRVGYVAGILSSPRRGGKTPYVVSDEYDVQDLTHALLRGYLKYSVQEDPIGKLAGTKSSRADVSIEELGIIVEIKFVRSPDDQKNIVQQFSEDLMLYAQWKPLKSLLYLVYNSRDLRDPEALLKLDGKKDINGKVFNTKMLLV
jgi:hypothetical protein